MTKEKVNSLYKPHFRILPDARRVFYPQGFFGRTAFVVESEAQEVGLKRYLFYFYMSCFVFGVMMGVLCVPFLFEVGLLGWSLGVGVAVFCSWLYGALFFLPVTRTMKKIKKPNNPIEKCEELGALMHPVLLVALSVSVYLSAVFCLLVFVFTQELFFGFCGLYFAVLGVPFTIAVTFRLSRSSH
ncbi:hypothetical protein [Acanthopleuribacter pedis]|uniref:Transmembrane protein n=1 Tax=Acanthopleuribacter pedis TaxID=442870 RepID=A0A8J7QFS3_9BACT|nr:hypothetical protein [Acanthopleuribacter pedis]MBO1317753.1 hypothetical protein [Acanthopleuribacter pedis]